MQLQVDSVEGEGWWLRLSTSSKGPRAKKRGPEASPPTGRLPDSRQEHESSK